MNFESDVREGDYGMFTEQGNIAVAAVVTIARAGKLTWPQTYGLLEVLSTTDPDKFGEAMDTEVREQVYDALGYTSSFYC